MPPTTQPKKPPHKHEVTRAELVLRWRGWYQAYDVYYICSCGRRLKEHGDNTVTHFQPETKGYAAVCNQMDTARAQAFQALQEQ
jgi:hypothetical protein